MSGELCTGRADREPRRRRGQACSRSAPYVPAGTRQARRGLMHCESQASRQKETRRNFSRRDRCSMLDARCSRSVVEFAPVTLAFAGVATMATDVPWRAFGGAGVALQFATVDTGRPARGRYGTRIRAIRPARHRLAHLRAATHDDTGASPDSGVSRSS